MRTLQEWMGHRDYKTTLIYADYAPIAHELDLVERAFGASNPHSPILAGPTRVVGVPGVAGQGQAESEER
jgi:hypothetical protein